jgi:hypothetical protein
MTTRSPSPELLQLGRGIIRWAPIVDGVRAPWLDMGNCESLNIATADTKIKKNNLRTSTISTYKEVTTEREVTLTIVGDEFDLDVLAAVMQGEVVTVAATAGGSVVAEALGQVTELGVILRLAKPLVDNVVLKQGMTTHVEGDDYEVVDAARGFVKILETGDITLNTAITADYDWAIEAAHKEIRGGSKSVVEASISFAADNAEGENRDVEVWRASLTSDGEQGFISEDFGTWTIKAKVLDDTAGDFGGSATYPMYKVKESPVFPA